MLMAAARLNIPAIYVSGGPMLAGTHKGQPFGNGQKMQHCIAGASDGHIRCNGIAERVQCQNTGNQIHAGDVVVIRYEGPKGGPGMREMLSPTAAIIGAGLFCHIIHLLKNRPAW